MTKERDKGSQKYRWLRKPIYKTEDAYSGAYLYSDQLDADYRGFLTLPEMADPQPVAEQRPLQIPQGAMPWIVRKEQATPIDVSPNEVTWDTWDEYWNTSEQEWGT